MPTWMISGLYARVARPYALRATLQHKQNYGGNDAKERGRSSNCMEICEALSA